MRASAILSRELSESTRMSDIEEKRVYSDRADRAVVYVASAVGIVRVTVSGAQVGRFGVVHRCTAADVACDDGASESVAVAADDDAYRSAGGDESDADVEDDDADGDDPAFAATGFGPATAVGFADGSFLAGKREDDAGRVARHDADAGEWETVGETGGVRTIDGAGGAVAAADGVYLLGDDLRNVGLSNVHDVTADGAGVPFAATGDGLYRLGNGWMDELPGAFRAVAAAGDRIHAVSGDGSEVFVRGGSSEDGDGAWTRVDLPTDDPVADVGHTAETTLLVTESGTLLSERESDWRSQVLGLRGATRLAVRQ